MRDVEGFLRMDEAFHHELEQLVRAARSGDSAATGQQIGVVLSRCSGCHEVSATAGGPPRHDTAHAH
ncbi:MAG: cytochrome c [Sandaracinaceae bacterium]|nr:cytochrome c [Sandaracinaceae bacterium]